MEVVETMRPGRLDADQALIAGGPDERRMTREVSLITSEPLQDRCRTRKRGLANESSDQSFSRR